MLAIRRQAGFDYASIVLAQINLICTSSSVYNWRILLNPTVVGTALSFSPVVGSIIEVAIPTSATTMTGGTVLRSGLGASTAQYDSVANIESPSDRRLGATVAGVEDILALVVQVVSGTSETFYGAINWREIY